MGIDLDLVMDAILSLDPADEVNADVAQALARRVQELETQLGHSKDAARKQEARANGWVHSLDDY